MRKLVAALVAVSVAGTAVVLALALMSMGNSRPCQREFGHNPGQRSHVAVVCE